LYAADPKRGTPPLPNIRFAAVKPAATLRQGPWLLDLGSGAPLGSPLGTRFAGTLVASARRAEKGTRCPSVMAHTPTSTVLALEPDNRRTDFLRAVICDQLRANLVVADTKDAAVAAISARIPDVVLVSPNFPPREEVELKDYLRSLQRSTAFEILKMPASSQSAPRARTRTGLLGALRRRAAGNSEESAEKDEGTALACRITGALDRVRNARADAAAWVSGSQPAADWRATPGPVPGVLSAPASSKPQVTGDALRSDARVGESPTKRATPRAVASVRPEVRDDNQDEWGFFDPSRCGYAALAATLDTLPEEVQENAELSPADMLLQFGTAEDSAASRKSSPQPVSASTHEETAGAARHRRKRDQPAPLALWAHLFGSDCGRPSPRVLLRYTEAIAGVAALLVGLNIPAQIAGVEYGSGCRIHRVRGLAGTEVTAPAISGAACSRPDSPPISHPDASEPTPTV
jgi:hypothetical protein